jgi:hypothetical protein
MMFPCGEKLGGVKSTALLLELLSNTQLILRRKNGIILVGQELEVCDGMVITCPEMWAQDA